MQYYGERIQEAREARGFDRKYLAALVGVSAAQLKRWETGEQEAEWEFVDRIAIFTKLPIGFFSQKPHPPVGDAIWFCRNPGY